MTRATPASTYQAVRRKARVPQKRDSRSALRLRFQDIARTSNGVDQLKRKGIVHFAAKPSHVDVNDVSVAVKIHVPDRLGDQGTRQNFACAARQHGEEKKFFGRQFEPLPGSGRTLTQQIDLQICKTDRLLSARWATTQQGAHARQQFGKSERLYQIIVSAQFESTHPLMNRIASSQKKHWYLTARLPQPVENFPTIQPRHHDVQNDEIELRFQRHVEPIQSVTCHIRDIARFSKAFLKKFGGLAFVFDDQNSHAFVRDPDYQKFRM